MAHEKNELEFDTARFMADIRRVCDADSLRVIADSVGVSASTLSRIQNGHVPDMQSFMTICQELELTPANYFKLWKWVRVEE